MRAAMWQCFVEADVIMRRAGRVLLEEEARALAAAFEGALTAYNALSVLFEEDNLYHCIPKMHMIVHMCLDTGRINPRFVQCYSDEDMVGRMKLIYSGCHGATAPLRSLQRYAIICGLRWLKLVIDIRTGRA